jgi:polyhydroxyalkanoate synthesis regulator phasin
MYGQIGMLPAFGTSTALQNWYEGKPVTDNVGRAMIDAFIIGGMTHAIASLPKLPAETARLFEHTIAKNYNKVSTVIDAAVQDGTINPTVGENIVAKAKAYDKIKGAGLNEDVEVQVTELQVQIDKLEASKEGASPAVIEEIDRQINELSTKLKVEAGFPLTFDERKELNLLQTARDSNKEYDKAKLAELEQRQKNNQDGKTKIVTDQPIRVKYKDGRTGLVFVNAEGDVEFVPDGNSAGLVIDKQAGVSFRSLANLGFEQVVGETIAEPNSQLLSGDISLGTSVLYKGGKYQIASSKNAPDGVKLDTDGKVRVVYLKGEDGKVIAVGADSVDGKRIIDDANRVIGKGEATPTETAPVQEETKIVEAQQPNAETVEVELEPTVSENKNDNKQHTAGYSAIALDYLFTGGRDVIQSTDYLLQALVGGFDKAALEIDAIRNKYADKLGNIKDDINSDAYKAAMQEIRDVIVKKYGDAKSNEIFDKILQNATGFTAREGNQVSIELESLNEQPVAEAGQEGATVPKVKTEKEITLFKGQMGKLNADGTKRTAHPNAEGFFASESEDTAKRYSGEDAPQKITLPKGVTIEEVQVADRNKPMSEIRREEENLINKSKAQVVVLKTIDAKGEEVQYIVKDKTLLEGKATPSDIKSTTEPTQEVVEQTTTVEPIKETPKTETKVEEKSIFETYEETKGASKRDKVLEKYAKENPEKAQRVREIIDNFEAIKQTLTKLSDEGKITNLKIEC